MKKIIATIVLTSVSTFSHAYCQGWECARGVWSDRNLKQNITPVESSLNKVSQLKGVTFEWKIPSETDIEHLPQGKDIGVIAQDVEKVFPELVHDTKVTDKNGAEVTLKQVNYAGLVGVLIEAVKELKQENKELREQLGL
ncbi:tail fiber domain-containing protein [Endozoicomonas sp. SM1973]|uniref:Tail fiber domain-containing protein n=1 Tax=Spartinivicinus marinus TaxID=2994442 RepID=A0A853IKP6_9GAMM|nr:tail fiber domain-containing protein [Spartinivicinus marinus]NYZ69937.1 tail fiber domain-containing protein [Spartinivicinus marinus]